MKVTSDRRFRERACPLCGSSEASVVFDLEAERFCAANWTYSNDFHAILDLPKEARFPIVQCLRCTFVYARLLPEPAFLEQVYERVIVPDRCREGSENAASYSCRLRYVAELIDLAAAGVSRLRALDFGSGVGVTLRILRASGIEAVGLDPSPSRAGYAAVAGCQVVREFAEIEQRGPFDLLICDNVLEHLPDPTATLSRLALALTPRAVVFVSVPDYSPCMIERQRRALREGRVIDMTLNPWEHLNYFTLSHLDTLMKRAGFRRLRGPGLAGPVDVGLRPEPAGSRRFKNALASAVRLARYALLGRGVETTERTFYRRAAGGE